MKKNVSVFKLILLILLFVLLAEIYAQFRISQITQRIFNDGYAEGSKNYQLGFDTARELYALPEIKFKRAGDPNYQPTDTGNGIPLRE